MNTSPDPEAPLGRWLAEEETLHARRADGPGPSHGVASREEAAGRDGLALMRDMLAGHLPAPPITATLDFLLLSADAGRAVFRGRPGAAHLNPMGTVHGGWFATLLDSAMGFAVHTLMPKGRGYTRPN